MKKFIPYIIIFCAGALLLFHSLGSSPLFDWDEINFAESAREMIVSGDYMRVQINFQPFWEKPPLFFWIQVLSMKAYGINEFAARFPNAICGIVTLMLLFYLGKQMRGEQFAVIWTLSYITAFLPHVYFKSGIIDPWFNLFIFLGIYQLHRFLVNVQVGGVQRNLYYSGIFTGLSVLTKGPVGILIVVSTYFVYIILNKGKGLVKFAYYLRWVFIVILITFIWFGLEIIQHGWWFINEFFTYQMRLANSEDAGHGGFLFYHFVVLFFGCFPISIFLLQKRKTTSAGKDDFGNMMWASIIVVLMIFSLVKTKIIHYSSFAYFPIIYLAAVHIEEIINGKAIFNKLTRYVFLFVIILWILLLVTIPILFINLHWLKEILKRDQFALANLNANVSWSYWMMLPGLFLLIGYLIFQYYLRVKDFTKGFFIMGLSSILTIQFALTFFAPRIEQYTQHAAIEFYKSLKEKNVYIRVLNYKSYAPYFYAEVLPPQRADAYDLKWLMYGKVDKPVYFVTRLDRKNQVMEAYGTQLKIVYEKNGFIFLERKNY